MGPKTYKINNEIKLNGFHRTYLVHIPSGFNPGKPLPLVVVINGAFVTAKGMEKFSGFSSFEYALISDISVSLFTPDLNSLFLP